MSSILSARCALLLAVVSLLSASAKTSAQAPNPAFAAAYAVTQTYQVCLNPSRQKAISCALKKCKQKAGPGCQLVAACEPAGWSGALKVVLEEINYTDTICGSPSKDALINALKVYCESRLPDVKECNVDKIWSPDGEEVPVQYSWKHEDFGAKEAKADPGAEAGKADLKDQRAAKGTETVERADKADTESQKATIVQAD